MADPYLAIKGLTALAESLGFSITPSSTGPYIYTSLDTFLKLDTEINEGWGSDEEYNTYYFDLDTPQGGRRLRRPSHTPSRAPARNRISACKRVTITTRKESHNVQAQGPPLASQPD